MQVHGVWGDSLNVLNQLALCDIMCDKQDMFVAHNALAGKWNTACMVTEDESAALLLTMHADYSIQAQDEHPWIKVGEYEPLVIEKVSVVGIFCAEYIRNTEDIPKLFDNMPVSHSEALHKVIGSNKFGFAMAIPPKSEAIIQETFDIAGKLIGLRVLLKRKDS